jgi:crotonobetainyl-CoA:carnitine CoA-transferase CaiB-like acyl-CoA transferase
MVFMPPPGDLAAVLAEETDDWPRACVICYNERGGLVDLAQSAEEGIEHRRRVHPWLQEWLDRHNIGTVL